jgi:hypothetical protein
MKSLFACRRRNGNLGFLMSVMLVLIAPVQGFAWSPGSSNSTHQESCSDSLQAGSDFDDEFPPGPPRLEGFGGLIGALGTVLLSPFSSPPDCSVELEGSLGSRARLVENGFNHLVCEQVANGFQIVGQFFYMGSGFRADTPVIQELDGDAGYQDVTVRVKRRDPAGGWETLFQSTIVGEDFARFDAARGVIHSDIYEFDGPDASFMRLGARMLHRWDRRPVEVAGIDLLFEY